MINFNSKIYVAGHNGLVGSAIVRELKKKGYKKIITTNRQKLDLTNQLSVLRFLKKNNPDFIFLAAAKVGGVYSNNKYKAEYLYENLAIQLNVINGAYLSGVKNLIFLGSSCIYPKNSKQPIKESYLLTGELEPTNDAYALAKITGIKLCESYNIQYKTNYKCLMPCNSYGPNDNYDEKNSHFFAALIKKIYLAKKNNKKLITIWGSGKPKRELIFVDDIADACVFFMNKKIPSTLINIGTGNDKTILEYAKILMSEFKMKLKIEYDKTKPDGVKKKLLNVNLSKKYGWIAKTSLDQGIKDTLESFNY